MDTDTVEFMLFLHQETSKLKRFGSKRGFSKEEIEACIDKALGVNISAQKNQAEKTQREGIWSVLSKGVKLVFKVLKATFLLSIGLYLASYYGPIAYYTSKVFQPYTYEVNRIIRLVTLPVHSFVDITAYYNSECIFENPFYQENMDAPECELCADIRGVTEVTHISHPLVRSYCNELRPFIYKNKGHKHVSFEDIVELYNTNKETVKEAVEGFHSTDAEISDIASLTALGSDINLLKRSGFGAEWTSKHKVFRSLFPRPTFIPPESEIVAEKQIYVDGPNAKQFEVNGWFYSAVFIQLVKGERKAVIKPVDSCYDLCSTLTVTIKEGEFCK